MLAYRKYWISFIFSLLFLLLSVPVYAYVPIAKGIDVSSYQGDIDWEGVASTDIKFAFIRCKSAITGVDNKFDENMSGAEEAGLYTGIYYYSGATSIQEAEAEAKYIIDCAMRHKPTLPLVLDIEGAEMYNQDSISLLNYIKAFCKKVRKAG